MALDRGGGEGLVVSTAGEFVDDGLSLSVATGIGVSLESKDNVFVMLEVGAGRDNSPGVHPEETKQMNRKHLARIDFIIIVPFELVV